MTRKWKDASLAEVCTFINRGISPKYLESGGIAVVNQKCIRDHEVNFDLCRRHDVKGKVVPSERFLCRGDVLVNSTGTGTLGRVAQVKSEPAEPTTVDSHVTIVRPAAGIFEPRFFGYAMHFIEAQLQNAGEGCGGQTELARSKLANDFRIRFPTDHVEQTRIVKLLDSAFAGIAIADRNTTKNAEIAADLLANYLRRKMAEALQKGSIRRLGDVVTRLTNGYVGPTRNIYQDDGVPYLTCPPISVPAEG